MTRPTNCPSCRRAACPCPQACQLPDLPQPTTGQRIATSLLAHAVFTALAAAGLVVVVIYGPSP